MNQKHFTEEIGQAINEDNTLSEETKTQILRSLSRLKETKVNILITGPTGCGKSSTINALFKTDKAKVGQGTTPETMDIAKYELNNIVIFDSPGLGDGKEADLRHSKNIIDKLYEKDERGDLLIDLVLVVLDGSTRDLGTSFELINGVIIPNLGLDKKRLLVAINQADMAMKGRGWNSIENKPTPELEKFLKEKCDSTKLRIKEATGINVDPIYYVAGYKDADKEQNPYNLSKLLLSILKHTKIEKRAVFAQDVNKDKKMWESDDRLDDYNKEIKKTMWDSVKSTSSEWAKVGGDIGSTFGGAGRVVGALVGGVCGAIGGVFSSLFG
jgi:predicted GTPase